MNHVAAELRILVEEATAELSQMAASEVTAKADAEAWSKQEILGHMIDSAANNHQRIIRAAANPTGITHHVYNQDDWVRIQQYQMGSWGGLLQLWSAYNAHLSTLIAHLPDTVLSARCDIGKEEPVTLDFVIRDYLRHVRHHLGEITSTAS